MLFEIYKVGLSMTRCQKIIKNIQLFLTKCTSFCISEFFFAPTMSKLLIVLVALSIAYAVQGKLVVQINMYLFREIYCANITKVNSNIISCFEKHKNDVITSPCKGDL